MNTKRVLQVIDTEFTLEDKAALARVDLLLSDLQRTFRTSANLTSLATGEVVGIEELSRVKGILGAFVESNYFQTSRNAMRESED